MDNRLTKSIFSFLVSNELVLFTNCKYYLFLLIAYINLIKFPYAALATLPEVFSSLQRMQSAIRSAITTWKTLSDKNFIKNLNFIYKNPEKTVNVGLGKNPNQLLAGVLQIAHLQI